VGVRAVRELADCAGPVPRVEARWFGAFELVLLKESIDQGLGGCDVVCAGVESIVKRNRDAAASAAGEDARAARVGCGFVCGDDCLHGVVSLLVVKCLHDVVLLLVVRLIGIFPDHPPWGERVNRGG
jgi:hypothetical protein